MALTASGQIKYRLSVAWLNAEVKPALPLLLLFFFLSLGFSFLDNRQLFKVALNCGMDNNYLAAYL